MESVEQLGFGQRNLHLYHQAETYFVLRVWQHDVVHGSEGRCWERSCRIRGILEEAESLQSEKQRWDDQ